MSRRKFMAGLGLVGVGLPGVFSRTGAQTEIGATYLQENIGTPAKIVVVGDLQRTSLVERMFLSREQNDLVRKKVVDAMAAEKPDAMLLLGDMVSAGEDEKDWKYFDELMSEINKAQIPVYAALGNHDYGFVKRGAGSLQLCFRRFPRCQNRPDVIGMGSIGLLTVDSNFDQMTPAVIREQTRLYKDALAKFDADPAIRAVIVASHHPPYTNSSLGPDQGVIENFAVPFLASKKTRLFFSGHVHSYERFKSEEKMFVVSGGGGGPRRSVIITPDRLFQNNEYNSGTLRPFHYIRLFVTTTAIEAQVVMYVNNEFLVGDRFALELEPVAQTQPQAGIPSDSVGGAPQASATPR